MAISRRHAGEPHLATPQQPVRMGRALLRQGRRKGEGGALSEQGSYPLASYSELTAGSIGLALSLLFSGYNS